MTDERLRALTGVPALVGLGIASYLTYSRYSGNALVCTTGGCEEVQSSSYAEVAGIPVAVLGLAGYVLLLGSALVPGELGRVAGVALAFVGLVFSVYLLAVQLFVIDAICIWCVANDGVMLAIAVVAIARLRLASRTRVEGSGVTT